MEAAKTYNLERTVQASIGEKLVEKRPDGTVKFRMGTMGFWTTLPRCSSWRRPASTRPRSGKG